MKILLRSVAVALLAAVMGVSGFTQTNTLTETTLSAAITDQQTRLAVASATDFAVNSIMFVDKEAMTISAVSGTNITVQRGQPATGSTAHASGTLVYVGTPDLFGSAPPAGSCTVGGEFVLPLIALDDSSVWTCNGTNWQTISGEAGGIASVPTVTSGAFTMGDITATYKQGPAFADAVSTIFFIADRAYTVTDIDAVWGTAEVTGAMAIQVQRLQGTEAIAAGDDLLNATIDATGTANTVANGTLTTTAAFLALAAGDRLAVELTITPNEVTDMVVTVALEVN